MKANLPLAGYVVVELSDNASAPFAGEILALLGAQVWKVERPAGDASRQWGTSQWKGTSTAFHVLNRGKQSICLDIKNPEHLALLHRLIEEHADVFLHNLRPGTAAQYRVDAESLRGRKPELVYYEMGAFGHTGPMRNEPGYDPLMQAFSGIMSLTGEADGGPVRSGVSIIDLGSGVWAALGVVAALLRRERKGGGVTVRSSLLETALSLVSLSLGGYAANGDRGARHGSGVGFIVPSGSFDTTDGQIMISCANERLFGQLCRAMGHPEWAADPRFASNVERVRNRKALDALIRERLAQESRAYWTERLQTAGVPTSPIHELDEVFEHEQVKALGILDRSDPEELLVVGLPLSFDGHRPRPGRTPALGEHNNDLFKALNATTQE